MQPLDYEPAATARSVLVEQEGEITRAIVVMQRLYAPVPRILTQMDLLGLFILPFWWVGSLLTRVCLRLPKPPRAVFEITREHVVMILRDPFTGDASISVWPRSEIREARANRYGPGLWVDVAGHTKNTYLHDVPRGTLQRLDAVLHAALTNAERSEHLPH